MLVPINDLHCDLLHYLALKPNRTADDPASRCSIPQLKKGGVVFQVLAIYEETKPGCSQSGLRQFSAFQNLLKTHPTELHLFKRGQKQFKPITIAVAIENASTLLDESEPFELCSERLEKMVREPAPPFYISLTWNQENRFGGGSSSQVGLKKDGELLLELMGRYHIPADLSHTSDRLAHDILNYIDKKGLKIRILASHSNFRKIIPVARNLTDEIAREIIRRKGLIGMNWFRHFVGSQPTDMIRHIEHGLTLGGEKTLCLGADYFSDIDSPAELHPMKPFQFPGYDDSSCYPEILRLLKPHFKEEWIHRLAHKNFEEYTQSL